MSKLGEIWIKIAIKTPAPTYLKNFAKQKNVVNSI